MTIGDWPAIIAALTISLGTLGTGLKWVLGKVDERIKAAEIIAADRIKVSEIAAEAARQKLEERFKAEIAKLQSDLADVRSELKNSLDSNSLFRRRIYQLENFIHKMPGVDIPDLEGWPPI